MLDAEEVRALIVARLQNGAAQHIQEEEGTDMAEKLTADTLTDEQIIEAISDLDTEIAILYAGIKIVKDGDLRASVRGRCADIINARSKMAVP